MQVELEPCPFCSGTKFQRNTKAKAHFEKKKAQREGRDGSNYLIRCTSCGAKGPLRHSLAEAEAAWNDRSLPQPSASSEDTVKALEPFADLANKYENAINNDPRYDIKKMDNVRTTHFEPKWRDLRIAREAHGALVAEIATRRAAGEI